MLALIVRIIINLRMNENIPIKISKSAAIDALCRCTGHDCQCLVMHYSFLDEHNKLMRVWFSVQIVFLQTMTIETETDEVDLSEVATMLAVMPDECTEDIHALLQLHDHDLPTMH